MNEPVPDELLVKLDLPFPPSVNHYWRIVTRPSKSKRLGRTIMRPTVLVSPEGEAYQKAVFGCVLERRVRHKVPPDARIAVYILLKMPDRHRRDIDNALKCCLDSITKAGVWSDDSQIDLLTVERGEVEAPGAALVEVYRLPGSQKVLTIGG